MTILLNKPYLERVLAKRGQKTQKSVHVVYGWPLMSTMVYKKSIKTRVIINQGYN